MDKKQFITTLKNRLGSLPYHEVEKIINYYDELINDKIEDGMSEEGAIKSLGNIDLIVNEIYNEIPVHEIVRRKVKNSFEFSSNKALWIIIAVLTSPIWFSILLAGLGLLFGLFVAIWAFLFSIIFVIGAFFISSIIVLIYSFTIVTTNFSTAILLWGLSLIIIGIFLLLLKPISMLIKYVAKAPGQCISYVKEKLSKSKEEV